MAMSSSCHKICHADLVHAGCGCRGWGWGGGDHRNKLPENKPPKKPWQKLPPSLEETLSEKG